jgi:hypothetical protein
MVLTAEIYQLSLVFDGYNHQRNVTYSQLAGTEKQVSFPLAQPLLHCNKDGNKFKGLHY